MKNGITDTSRLCRYFQGLKISKPEHIELEKEWALGRNAKGGRADICVYNTDNKLLFIIECKTSGGEYKKEYNNTLQYGLPDKAG